MCPHTAVTQTVCLNQEGLIQVDEAKTPNTDMMMGQTEAGNVDILPNYCAIFFFIWYL